jgi:CHAT domain
VQQGELRRVNRQLEQAKGARAAELARQRAELEATIRARARLVRGPRAASTTNPVVGRAAKALGGRVLIEYLEIDQRIGAVSSIAGRTALHDLAGSDALADLDWLRLGLRRLAAEPRGDRRDVDAAAAALDRLLVAPLLEDTGTEPVVIVPTGPLHAVPWALLPSLRGRVVTVAPSLRLWLRLAERAPPRRSAGKTVLIAGPRLRHAVSEVKELAALRPDAFVVTGAAATATATLAALDGAALAHVACHGRFRADAPLFSSLELADGPLTAYDLQGMRTPPEVLVLSACDLALSDRRPGDELLGVAASLLAMGTRTVVASVVPVHDAASRRLMRAFHRELLDAPPATALARAQATAGRDAARVAGFVCLGFG